MLSRVVGRLIVDGFRVGARAAAAVPPKLAAYAASGVGAVAAAVAPTRRSMLERHLVRADPTLAGPALRRASRAAFQSYARYYLESLQLPSLSDADVRSGLTIEGYERVREALAAGSGVILALPHLGGWEWGGRWVTEQGTPMTVVAEPLEPPELFEWFTDVRSGLGMSVVPLGPSATSAVMTALRANHVVCLLCDRDVGGGGVEVEFFGERTTLPAGPAALALRTGAPLLPAAVYFADPPRGHHAVVRPPVEVRREGKLRDDVARVTQALARELETLIRHAPQQWHLLQPNWPSDPGHARAATAGAATAPTR